jgi:hypothetical protein
MPVSFADLLLAFEFVSSGSFGEHEVFLCKESGKTYWGSDYGGEEDELPEDIDDDERYVQVPDKRELDLGNVLALKFAGEFLPDDFDDVRRIFDRRGAYARFKDLLQRRRVLDQWYEFEARATEAALRAWCEENAIEVTG